MFQTSYAHHQEDYIVLAALYCMLFMHLCMQSVMMKYQAHHDLYFRTVHVVIFILFKPTHALFLKHIHIHI